LGEISWLSEIAQKIYNMQNLPMDMNFNTKIGQHVLCCFVAWAINKKPSLIFSPERTQHSLLCVLACLLP
jgi:hypothetical protein